MERSLIKQVNKKNMAARLNTRHVKPVVFPELLRGEKKDFVEVGDIDW